MVIVDVGEQVVVEVDDEVLEGVEGEEVVVTEKSKLQRN